MYCIVSYMISITKKMGDFKSLIYIVIVPAAYTHGIKKIVIAFHKCVNKCHSSSYLIA